MGAWVTGHNLAGSEPDVSDEYHTSAFAEWGNACTALGNEMREHADADDEAALKLLNETAVLADYPEYESQGFGDDQPSMAGDVAAVLKDSPPREGENYLAHVEDNAGQRIAFWLQWSDDREPDQED